jgi:hypothetical protein
VIAELRREAVALLILTALSAGCGRSPYPYDPAFSYSVASGQFQRDDLVELALFRGDPDTEDWPFETELAARVALWRGLVDSEATQLLVAALQRRDLRVGPTSRETRCVLYLEMKGSRERRGLAQILVRDRSVYVTAIPEGDTAGFEVNTLGAALQVVLGGDPCSRR